MRDIESEMNAALNGKFFWEPTSNPGDKDSGSLDIRRAQRKIAGKARVVTTRISSDVVSVESIKPMKRVLKGEEKVLEPIVRAISEAYDVSMDNIFASSTSRKYAKAKMHLYWAMFKYIPGLSLSEAGRLIRKCRTTVLHGRTMFEKNMDMRKVVEVDRLMGVL